MAVPLELFQKGDVYIDFPYEDLMYRYEFATRKLFCKFYGRQEAEIALPFSGTCVLVAAGSVWVTAAGKGELYRIDPSSNALHSSRCHRHPSSLPSGSQAR